MTSKVYSKLVRAINLKTGKVQWISQFIADNTPFLEKNGFKIDDPEYAAFLKDEEKVEEIVEQKEVQNEEVPNEEQTKEVKPKRKPKTK